MTISRFHGDLAPTIHHAMAFEQQNAYVFLVIFWLLRFHSFKDWIPVILTLPLVDQLLRRR